jgi:hypothetical protein
MREVEGIGLATDERTAAANDVFYQFARKDRHQHGKEQELQAYSKAEQQRSPHSLRGRRSHRHDNQQPRDRAQHINVLAEIGQDADGPKAGGAALRHQADLAHIERIHQRDDGNADDGREQQHVARGAARGFGAAGMRRWTYDLCARRPGQREKSRQIAGRFAHG